MVGHKRLSRLFSGNLPAMFLLSRTKFCFAVFDRFDLSRLVSLFLPANSTFKQNPESPVLDATHLVSTLFLLVLLTRSNVIGMDTNPCILS